MSTTQGDVKDDLKNEVQNIKEANHADMIEQSKAATQVEHSLGVIEAVKLYPYAVCWAALFAWSLVRISLPVFCDETR
jgi:hypothetical protein